MAKKEDIVFTKNKRFVAEWNTGEDSLRQLALFEMNIDKLCNDVNNNIIMGKSFKVELNEWYNLMIVIYYRRLRSCMFYLTQEAADKKRDVITELFNEWRTKKITKIPTTLIFELNKFYGWLLEVKQKLLNLGVPMRVDLTAEQRLNKAIQ